MQATTETLALHGGPRAVRDPLPNFLGSAGRTFGREEKTLVLQALRSGCLSLQQSKHITCGEGGLMVTANDAFARRALLFSDKAWPRDTAELGRLAILIPLANYRMSELQGAVALGQLDKIPEVIERRRSRAEQLSRQLSNIPGVRAPHILRIQIPPGGSTCCG